MKRYIPTTDYGILSDYIGMDVWIRVASANNSSRSGHSGQFIRILSADNKGILTYNVVPGYLVDHPHSISPKALGAVVNDIYHRDASDFIVVEPLDVMPTDTLMRRLDG